MKKIVITIILTLTAVLILPLSIFSFGVFYPSQFTESYYGELVYMHNKLKENDDPKIVILGNSNIAFGVDSKLIEDTLKESGLNYRVCNFGLYGSIGTKAMMELSQNHINEGDIVIFAPEISDQSFSLYFSATELYRSIEEDKGMMFELNDDTIETMVGNFTNYCADKFQFVGKDTSLAGTVYARSSFDENCDMKNYPREYNEMLNMVDTNNLVTYDVDYLDDEFVSYVNDYYAKIRAKGAEMYFSFSPENKSAVLSSDEEINDFYNALEEKFDFKIISNPYNYILDAGWFYNSNCHTNTYGMTVRTNQLIDDIKNEFHVITPNNIVIPSMPAVPGFDPGEVIGSNEDEAYFTYEENEDGIYATITGLSEEGKSQREVTVPYTYNGKKITSFTADTFAGNTSIQKITLQKNIKFLHDYSFNGCTSLKALILEHDSPDEISVGTHLLDGCENLMIYIKESIWTTFLGDYNWGKYGTHMESY